MTIACYPGLIAAGKAHFKQRCEDGVLEIGEDEYSQREWLEILSRAATTRKDRRIVRKALEQDEF